MSIMDTLITNRTQADVISGNAKGTYNASDLNRVGEAEEYLHDLFESYGYSMPNYKRIKLQRPGHYETHTVIKPVLPDEYTQLEYIESTGTQYIDTGVAATSSLRFEVDFTPHNDIANPGFGSIFGARSDAYQYVLNTYPNTSGGSFHCGAAGGSSNADPELTKDVRCQVSYLGTVFTSAKGTTTEIASAPEVGLPLSLFARNMNGTRDEYGKVTLYGMCLYDGGTLVRVFSPAKRLSDNAIGLYDKVEQKFYPNAGTGVFTAGPENIEYETIAEEVFVPDERDPYTWFEDDIPTSGIMAQYITNLSELRGQFAQAATTPDVPPDMDGLSWQEANDIEKILEDVDALLTNIAAAWFYSGEIYSGEA